PPLMIDPVDFASLYQQRMMAEAQRLQPVGQA
ncbi:MAG: protein-export chaperone SecB, partial [Rhizobiales bacterium 35-66-30]